MFKQGWWVSCATSSELPFFEAKRRWPRSLQVSLITLNYQYASWTWYLSGQRSSPEVGKDGPHNTHFASEDKSLYPLSSILFKSPRFLTFWALRVTSLSSLWWRQIKRKADFFRREGPGSKIKYTHRFKNTKSDVYVHCTAHYMYVRLKAGGKMKNEERKNEEQRIDLNSLGMRLGQFFQFQFLNNSKFE